MAIGAQRLGQFCHLGIGKLERFQLGQLAADMHVDADHIEPRQRGGHRINLSRAGDRNAELVLGFAGGDLGMGLGVHVRIDPHGDRHNLAQRLGNRAQQLHLGLGFDVELANPPFDGNAHFLNGLAHAREHDLVARHPRRLGAQVFPDGDNIHARTRFGERL